LLGAYGVLYGLVLLSKILRLMIFATTVVLLYNKCQQQAKACVIQWIKQSWVLHTAKTRQAVHGCEGKAQPVCNASCIRKQSEYTDMNHFSVNVKHVY
jgi:hypothetical protein